MKCDQTCIKTESCVKTGLRNITARVNEFIISVFAIAFSVMFTCYEKCQTAKCQLGDLFSFLQV